MSFRRLILHSSLCFLLLSGCAMNAPAAHGRKHSRKVASETAGPIDDCLMNSQLYSRENNIASQCTSNYVHFFPKKTFAANASAKAVRIGSFNLFHLGDNQAPMKNIALVASIMNRWDIVGAQELMPLPLEWSINNQQIYDLISGGDQASFPYENWEVMKPGYLTVLVELQKLDPSWALIMQSQPEGDGTTGEMAGFFYRSRQVSLKEWSYCAADKSVDLKTKQPDRNLACLLKVPDAQKNLISRTAFAAYFKAGNFDFVGLTAHVRFTPDQTASHVAAQKKSICEDFDGGSCKIALNQVGRYFEVKVAAAQLADLQKSSGDKDVVYMADTNLEMNAKSLPLWTATLKSEGGLAVYQSDKSTLSVRANRLASNYDHFILSPGSTSECDTSSIRAYNYWKETSLTGATAMKSDDPVVSGINTYLRTDGQAKMLAASEDYFARLIKIQSGKEGEVELRPLTGDEQSRLKLSCSRAVARMKKNKTGALMELLSDHLPIEMNCRIDGPDDD